MNNHQVLTPKEHRDLRIHTDSGSELGDAVMACLTVPLEFRSVQSSFPIVFRRDVQTGEFSVLALFGFENGENLFLKDGRWDARYRPLAMAIQPFLIGQRNTENGGSQVHVDMGHPRISTTGEGVRLFDENGMQTPFLERAAESVGDLDYGYRQTPAFIDALVQHDLLEPFTLEIPLDDGSRNSLVGFHTIDENRLTALDGGTLGTLSAEGHLLPIFMVLASLSRFGDLVARKNALIFNG